MKISKETRIYVAGCGGMLGEAVYNHFNPLAELMATDIETNRELRAIKISFFILYP